MPTCENPHCVMHPQLSAAQTPPFAPHAHEWHLVHWDNEIFFECRVCHTHVPMQNSDTPFPPRRRPALTTLPSADSLGREVDRLRAQGEVPEELDTILNRLVFLAREKNPGPEIFGDEEFDRQEREAIESEPVSVYSLLRHPKL